MNLLVHGMNAGVSATCLAAIFWRPQTPVFFDQICISSDPRLKTQAIFSLAGMMKSTDTMLILWDPTWAERLWCLFELAAFLKTKETQKQVLVVRPIFLGPISIAIFLTVSMSVMPITTAPIESIDTPTSLIVPISAILLLGLVVLYPVLSTIRSYFRHLEVMKRQLQAISFDTTRSACCDLNHVSATGTPLFCDRKIVKECVKSWFGSQKDFEEAVRSEVLEVLNRDLTETVFSGPWILGVTTPTLLAFMDLSATFAQDFQALITGGSMAWSVWDHPALCLFIEGLVLWLVAFPPCKDIMILCCRIMRTKPKSRCFEAMKNTLTLVLVTFPLCIIIACYGLTRFIFSHHAMMRAGAFAGSVFLISFLHCLLALLLKAFLRRPGW